MYALQYPKAYWVPAGIAIPRMTKSSIHYAVAIVGAVIMPHNIYLHSALVQSRYPSYTC